MTNRPNWLPKPQAPFWFAGSRMPMATRRSAETLTETILAGFAFIFLMTVLFAGLYLADSLINAPAPTERCFTTAAAETDYCREQLHWR